MSFQNIEEIFEAFNSLKVLIIGDVMVDAYIWGAVERISPEAPVPVVRASKRDYRLGGAGNVALNTLALGATPILCSVIGNDEAGINLITRLNEKEINTAGLTQSTERPTTVKTRVMSGHQHIVRVDEEADKPLSLQEEQTLLDKVEGLMAGVDVIVFEDYDKGIITPGLIDRVVTLARQFDIPTVVDPKKRNFLNYKGVTLFKPNFKELKEGLKLELDKHDQPAVEQAVTELIKLLNCDGALITLSERGVFIDYQSEQHVIPAHLREISDVSGAGDTVISIVAACVALKLSPYLTAALSNLGGGLVCEHVGVVPINRSDLLQEAQKQHWL